MSPGAPPAGGATRAGGRLAGLARLAWDHLEEGALCLLLAAMVVISFATVVTRYILDLPLSYIDQLVPDLFVWVTFLGASAAVKRRAHLGLSLVYDALPPRGRAALDVAILAGTVAFFLAAAWYGWTVVVMQAQTSLTSALGYPAWLVGAAVPAGALLFAVRSLEAWRRHRRGGGPVASSAPAV